MFFLICLKFEHNVDLQTCVSHIQPRGASFACPIFTSKAFSEKSVFILGTPAAKAVHCVREIRLENIYFVVLSCS